MVTAVGRSTERSAPDGLLGVAAEYATESVPVARRDQRVAEVRGQLTGREFRCAEDVVVLESGRLDGLVSIERLLAADPDASIEDIMDPEPPKVAPDTDQGAPPGEWWTATNPAWLWSTPTAGSSG
jgi:magnesium transporter